MLDDNRSDKRAFVRTIIGWSFATLLGVLIYICILVGMVYGIR